MKRIKPIKPIFKTRNLPYHRKHNKKEEKEKTKEKIEEKTLFNKIYKEETGMYYEEHKKQKLD